MGLHCAGHGCCVKTAAMVKVANYGVKRRIYGPKNGSVWRPVFGVVVLGKREKYMLQISVLGPPGRPKNGAADLYFFELLKQRLSCDVGVGGSVDEAQLYSVQIDAGGDWGARWGCADVRCGLLTMPWITFDDVHQIVAVSSCEGGKRAHGYLREALEGAQLKQKLGCVLHTAFLRSFPVNYTTLSGGRSLVFHMGASGKVFGGTRNIFFLNWTPGSFISLVIEIRSKKYNTLKLCWASLCQFVKHVASTSNTVCSQIWLQLAKNKTFFSCGVDFVEVVMFLVVSRELMGRRLTNVPFLCCLSWGNATQDDYGDVKDEKHVAFGSFYPR